MSLQCPGQSCHETETSMPERKARVVSVGNTEIHGQVLRRAPMTQLTTALAILFSVAVAGRADEKPQFGGEWKTTMGPVTLEQKGQDVSGRIEFFKLPLEGKVEGKELKLGYDEGRIHVDAMIELESSGNSFKGTFKACNGNRGFWNGWRPDPAATSGK